MLINTKNAVLLVIDVQEKLLPSVVEPTRLRARIEWLLNVGSQLGLALTFSEQYPQGLGHTVASLRACAPKAPVVSKTYFSCVAEQCLSADFLDYEQVILVGIEMHVCVLQTALELRQLGKQVFIVSDCVSARTQNDIDLALLRCQQAGVVLVTREMVLFELLRCSGTEEFKAASRRFLMGAQPA